MINLRNILTAFFVAFLLTISAVGVVYASHNGRFKVRLTGDQEIPPVFTQMNGKAKFRASESDNAINFDLAVRHGLQVTAAHIHCGTAQQNGPVVAHLFGDIPGGFDVDGELAKFTLRDANIVSNTCGPAITNIAELIDAMQDGRTYVNVHTVAHPSGEIRGHIVLQ